MRRSWSCAALLASLLAFAGCAVGYSEEYETIKAEPLADEDLLGLELERASGSAGLRGRSGPHVYRAFENPGEPPGRLAERVKQLAVESGWAAERCTDRAQDGGGLEYLLYLTKREEVMIATVTADDAELTVDVAAFPGGGIAEFTQTGEPAC